MVQFSDIYASWSFSELIHFISNTSIPLGGDLRRQNRESAMYSVKIFQNDKWSLIGL